MKLDRNINADGVGKYALVQMRKLRELLVQPRPESLDLSNAWALLIQAGVIHFGDEGPGEQFFVMKYKDKFSGDALHAYAEAANEEAKREFLATGTDDELAEYVTEMYREAACAKSLGNRIPD